MGKALLPAEQLLLIDSATGPWCMRMLLQLLAATGACDEARPWRSGGRTSTAENSSSSGSTRHALTVALVKPGRGALAGTMRENLLSAMLYTRFVMGELTLSSTRAFSFVHPAIFCTAIKSSFWILLMGTIGSCVMSDVSSMLRLNIKCESRWCSDLRYREIRRSRFSQIVGMGGAHGCPALLRV